MLGRDIGQLLQVVLLGQKTAKTLHGLVVPLFGAVAALSVVAGNLVQLGDEGVVDTLVADLHSHMKTSKIRIEVQMGAVRPLADPSVSPFVPAFSLKDGALPELGSLDTQGLSRGTWSRIKSLSPFDLGVVSTDAA